MTLHKTCKFSCLLSVSDTTWQVKELKGEISNTGKHH